MDKLKLLTASKLDCIKNGRKQTGFKISDYLDKEIEQLKAINDAEFYVMHSTLLELGIKELNKISNDQLMARMMEFRKEDKSKMHPKSYSINQIVNGNLIDIKDKLDIPTIVEAHYIALKLGIQKFNKLK